MQQFIHGKACEVEAAVKCRDMSTAATRPVKLILETSNSKDIIEIKNLAIQRQKIRKLFCWGFLFDLQFVFSIGYQLLLTSMLSSDKEQNDSLLSVCYAFNWNFQYWVIWNGKGHIAKLLEDLISKEAVLTALKKYTSFQITTHFLLTKIFER